MATKALTLGARRPVFDRPSAKEAPGRGSDWRTLLLKEDAQDIWEQIESIVRALPLVEETHPDYLTQDLFIHLLATGRFRFYLDKRFTDDQIKRDILSLISI